MFKNNSDNPKAPVFRLKVNAPKEDSINDYIVPESPAVALANKYGDKVEKTEDKPYIDFGTDIQLTDDDIEIAF